MSDDKAKAKAKKSPLFYSATPSFISSIISMFALLLLPLFSSSALAVVCEAVQVNVSSLSVRTGPSTGYARVGTVHAGEQYVKVSEQGNWAEIGYDEGTKWISAANYTSAISTNCGKVTVGSLNVRRGPGSSYSKVGTMPKDSKWVMLGHSTSGTWEKVYYKSEIRWVYGLYLDASGVAPPPPISVSNFVINGGSTTSLSQFVTVTQSISGSNASAYQLSESATFSAANWNAFVNPAEVTLSAGNGEKTLYYRVKNAAGRVSDTVSDSIILAVPIASQRSIDPAIFFNEYRTQFGSMSQGQVDGINLIMTNMEKDINASYQNLAVYSHQMAYLWATVKHEVANTYQPITEFSSTNCVWYDGGCRYKGRGYVQLTHQFNYAAMSPVVGVDLVIFPELALDAEIAYTVMSYGSFNGVFTGRALGQYINSGLTDYYNARRVINGTDKASLIQGYAQKFQLIMDKAAQ